ncbi:MAG: hypothetical protein HY735_32760 [Verrucomicrobia bacterium]|nr:hypothetical protein [Verrucomicrobiota bacterium]
MDKKCLQIPVDFASRTEFRLLERAVEKPGAATVLFLYLWRAVAYAAENGRLGSLSRDEAALLAEDTAFLGLENPISLLTAPNGFLVSDGDGYFCPLFAADNKALSPNFVPIQRQGGLARGVVMKRRSLEGVAQQQSLLLDPALFKRPDGNPMSPDEINRAIMLIKLLDGYLGRRARLNSEFSPGLVADAYRADRAYSEDTINRFCSWLYVQRQSHAGHPGLPETTEQVLHDFDRYAKAVEN